MMRKKLNWNPLDRRGSFPYYYAILPVAGTIVCNMLTYYGSRPITQGLPHWDLTLPLDRWIPFVPSAVSIYVLAFVSWVIGIWVIARESPAVCYEVLAGEQIAKLLCLVCFFLLPTTMERPEVPGSDPRSPGWSGSFIRWTPQTICSPPFIAWRTGCAFVGPSAAGRWDGDIKLAC